MKRFFGDESKAFKFKRHFLSIPASDIKHYTAKSVLMQRLDGINSTHCFLMMNAQRIMYRKLTCVCARCIDGAGHSACKHSSVCGKWLAWRPRRVSAPIVSSNNSSASSRGISPVSLVRNVGGPPPLVQERGGYDGRDMSNRNVHDRYHRSGNGPLDIHSNEQQRIGMTHPISGHLTAADHRYDPLRSWDGRR